MPFDSLCDGVEPSAEPAEAGQKPAAPRNDGSRLDTASGLAYLQSLLAEHEAYRGECLNMVASENLTSPAVMRLQTNELSHRYGDYRGCDPSARKYMGNRHIARIEQFVTGLVRQLFRAQHVDLRPLSGHVAGEAALMALCRPGDTVMELDATAGGHRLAEKLCAASLIDLRVVSIPFDPVRFNIDVDRCREAIRELRPRVVVLGSSNFLFPNPVSAIREMLDAVPGSYLVYDASHVLGLIAGGRFQRPLEEGAHLVVASTHKTFGGPQGGLVLTNEAEIAEQVAQAIYPALVTNHHLHRIPPLGAACLEWLRYGQAHAEAVIENARAFAQQAAARGLSVVGNAAKAHGGDGVGGSLWTDSHTVLLATREYGRVARLAERLESAGVIAGATVLPERYGRSGIRFGLQELTRRGMRPSDAGPLAQIVARVLTGQGSQEEWRAEASVLAQRFNQCRFALE